MARRTKHTPPATKAAPETPDNAVNARGARRGEILRVAETVFAKKGFVNATVRDIGEASGILSGSLYHHFDSKDTMLEEILRDLLQDLIEHLRAVRDREADSPAVIREMIEVTLARVLQRPAGFRILDNDFGFLHSTPRFAFVESTLDDVKRMWAQVIDRGVAEGTLRADLDVRLACLLLFHATISVVRWRTVPTLKTVAAVADQMSGIYVEGMRPR